MDSYNYKTGNVRNHCCSGKGISITYSECVFLASGIQYAKRCRIILPSLFCPALQYFSTLYHKRRNYQIRYGARDVILLSVQLSSETFLTLRIILRDTIIYGLRSSCKVPVNLVRF